MKNVILKSLILMSFLSAACSQQTTGRASGSTAGAKVAPNAPIGSAPIGGSGGGSRAPAPAQAQGGVDGSGGNVQSSGSEDIDKVLKSVRYALKLAYHRIDVIRKIVGSIDNGTADLSFTELQKGVHTHEPFEQTVDRLKFHLVQRDCSSSDGDRTAAAQPSGDICLSVPRLKQLAPESLAAEITALLFHEVVHVRGLAQPLGSEENDAQELQKWILANQKVVLRQIPVDSLDRIDADEPLFDQVYEKIQAVTSAASNLTSASFTYMNEPSKNFLCFNVTALQNAEEELQKMMNGGLFSQNFYIPSNYTDDGVFPSLSDFVMNDFNECQVNAGGETTINQTRIDALKMMLQIAQTSLKIEHEIADFQNFDGRLPDRRKFGNLDGFLEGVAILPFLKISPTLDFRRVWPYSSSEFMGIHRPNTELTSLACELTRTNGKIEQVLLKVTHTSTEEGKTYPDIISGNISYNFSDKTTGIMTVGAAIKTYPNYLDTLIVDKAGADDVGFKDIKNSVNISVVNGVASTSMQKDNIDTFETTFTPFKRSNDKSHAIVEGEPLTIRCSVNGQMTGKIVKNPYLN